MSDCNDPRDDWANWRNCNRDDCCESDPDFHEEDEPVEDVTAAFERGEPCLTGRPRAGRWVSADGGAVLTCPNVVGVPTYCGAPMAPA